MHTTAAMITLMQQDAERHGVPTRITSSSVWTVGVRFADGHRNRYATPDNRDTREMNEAIRVAFPATATRLFA